MGITVAKIIMVVVDSPLLSPPLVSPLVVMTVDVTCMFAIELPFLRRLLRLLRVLLAAVDPGAALELTCMVTVTDPDTMLRITMSLTVTPAVSAIWFMKAT